MNKEHGAAIKNKNTLSQREDDRQTAVAAAQFWSANTVHTVLVLEDMKHFRVYLLPPEHDGKPWHFHLGYQTVGHL